MRLKPGDNISAKVQEGLNQAEALIVVISENSFRSPWVQQEFAAIAALAAITGNFIFPSRQIEVGILKLEKNKPRRESVGR